MGHGAWHGMGNSLELTWPAGQGNFLAQLHQVIGPPRPVALARPEATQLASDARFVMVLHESRGACFVALGHDGKWRP